MGIVQKARCYVGAILFTIHLPLSGGVAVTLFYGTGKIFWVIEATLCGSLLHRYAAGDAVSGPFQPQVGDVFHGGLAVMLLEKLTEIGLPNTGALADGGGR